MDAFTMGGGTETVDFNLEERNATGPNTAWGGRHDARPTGGPQLCVHHVVLQQLRPRRRRPAGPPLFPPWPTHPRNSA
ncbi:MAG: hypothetical protein MZV70_54305 [Desulfobacterales bacterium]|nr:hypothetical protein [Desulfobacterales bacterium]